MRVAIDVRACLGPVAGVNVYTAELIKALAQEDVELVMWFAARQVAAVGQMLLPELQTLQPRVRIATTPIPNALLYTNLAQCLWRHWPRRIAPPTWLPQEVDLYHAPFWPLPLDAKIPMVLTIHDLLSVSHPAWGTRRIRSDLATVRALAPRAAHVLTDSDATRHDVLRLARLRPERVTTVHLGVDPCFGRPIAAEEMEQVRNRYDLSRPYLLSLGTREPRKNLGRLIDAYDLLCERQGAEWDLLVIGAIGWGEDAVTARLARSRQGQIRATGHIPRQDLAPLLAGAAAMGYVSLGEGFGLPPLEAMAAGCPVVVSNVSSLPEVVGDAALQVDPLDVEAIADGLHRVLSDGVLANQLRMKGKARAAGFTWEKTARQTLAVYRQVLDR